VFLVLVCGAEARQWLDQDGNLRPGIELCLALGAGGEKLAAAGAKLAFESGDEFEGFGRQHTLVARLHRALDGNAVRNRRGCCLAHARSPPWSIFSMSVCARSYSLDTFLSNIS